MKNETKNQSNDYTLLIFVVGIVGLGYIQKISFYLTWIEKTVLLTLTVAWVIAIGYFYAKHFSVKGKDLKKKKNIIAAIPKSLKISNDKAVKMGLETDLGVNLYLPDSIRSRHVHILGATGSGKTESVILNFLGQDIKRGLGSIILDAKGDQSFIDFLKHHVPEEKLVIFDLTDENSTSYNPLKEGSPLEATQRLFSSMNWSEEYYKAKAFTAIQMTMQHHFSKHGKNPTLSEIKRYIETPALLAEILGLDFKNKSFERENSDISGLRDQIRSLTIGHLEKLLTDSNENEGLNLSDVFHGKVIYFRLQSLLSPQAVQMLGKLIIQNINYLTGKAHREGTKSSKLVPIYLDEFASFASPEFADLISKARSARFSLHFSHQSVGDIEAVAPGFINRITDNSGTKIVLRINDPDSAEFFARAFGTKMFLKSTLKVTNSTQSDTGEISGDGTIREAHQFRASPDTFKTLPTGMGSVLVSHGEDTIEGASHVFKIRFPRLQYN